jgi:hypothetical protein
MNIYRRIVMLCSSGSKMIAILVACSVLVLAGVTVASAASFEYPYIYKSLRVMGMGGANVAIGGSFDSVFYNPAGLARMPQDGNWDVNLLGLGVAYGEDTKAFIDELQDAFDVPDGPDPGTDADDEQSQAVNDVLEKYRGQNMHGSISELTFLAKNSETVGFGLGFPGSFDMNVTTHQGLGSEGLMRVDAYIQYGGVLGMSYRINENVSTGIALKFLNRDGIDHNFTAREIIENEDRIEDYLTEDLRKEGSAFGVDAGVIYEFDEVAGIVPAVGLSVQNIGDLDFDEAGEIPMTTNLGFAASSDVAVLDSVTVGLDYVDIMNEYTEDSDIGKRLRIGAEVQLFDTMPIAMAIRTGMYQSYFTGGIDFRLGILKLAYTTYAEEIGAYAGQDEDRRHMASLYFGW